MTAVALTSVALPPDPVVLAEMVPVTLSWSRSMSAPAAVVVNLAVPSTCTTPAPVSVMPVVPPLVTSRLPVMCRAVSVTLAALKLMVRLLRLLRPVSDGIDAVAELLPSARLRTLLCVPAKMMAPRRLLPPLPSRMSEFGLPTVSVRSPPVLSVAPAAWVMWLPEVMLRVPPTFEVASSTSLLLWLTRMALPLAPVVFNAKVPVTFWSSTVIVALLADVV